MRGLIFAYHFMLFVGRASGPMLFTADSCADFALFLKINNY
jgi:hypothetical protein